MSACSDYSQTSASKGTPSPSSSELNQACHAVEQLFEFIPPPLHLGENHTTSDGTRPPAPYDLHLADDLILREIVYCPSIVDDLLEIAEASYLDARDSGKLPPSTTRPPSRDDLLNKLLKTADKIVDETTLTDAYGRTYAQICTVLAAALELQHPEWHTDHLVWQRNLRTGSKDVGVAVPDAYLSLAMPSKDDAKLSDELRVVEERFPALAIWEFKNLKAGGESVMRAMVSAFLGKPFPWQRCDAPNCAIGQGSMKGKHRTTGNKMGFDVDEPVCISVLRDGKKVYRISVRCQDTDLKKAIYIWQQSWAEGVHYDATFIIINTGNFEIIAIRDRKSQRLYITDVIEISECKYVKLQFGLYVAILRDALGRANLLTTRGFPDAWLRSFERPQGNDDPFRAMSLQYRNKYIMYHAGTRDSLVFTASSSPSYTPFLPNTIYTRVSPAGYISTLEKSSNSNGAPPIKITLPRKALTAVLGPSTVLGSLEIDGYKLEGTANGSNSGKVLIKSACGPNAVGRLRYEYQIYIALANKQVLGVPRMIGLFEATLPRGEDCLEFASIVMEDVGHSLQNRPDILTDTHVEEFKRILKCIHGAGILHKNISVSHLMISKCSASIISFTGAEHLDPAKDKDMCYPEEETKLATLLADPLAHCCSKPDKRKTSDLPTTTYPYRSSWKLSDDDGVIDSETPCKKKRVSMPKKC